MTCWAIILRAGGADDCAGRLLRVIAGQPLLGRAVTLARSCRPSAAVCICSGDADVLAFGRREGVATIASSERDGEPEHSLRPTARQVDRVMRELAAHQGVSPAAVVWVSPLYPLLRAEDLEEAARALANRRSAFAAVEAPGPVWFQETPAGTAGSLAKPRSGGRLLLETGAFYGLRIEAPHGSGGLPADGAAPVVLSRESALRADTAADLYAAEEILRERQAGRASSALPNPLGAIVFDFDGVFTDNRVVVFEDGREAAVCDRGDGWGLGQLRRDSGVPILVLSTERNPIVKARCRKLGLECIHGVADKLPVLHQWLEARRIRPGSVAYLGNDLNDLACMRAVGCPVAVADAYPRVKAAARIVLTAPGGKGAVREFTEIVAAALSPAAMSPAPVGALALDEGAT